MGTAIERVSSPAGVDGGSRVASAIFNKKVLAVALVVALLAGGLYWLLSGTDALAAMTVRVDSGSVQVIRDGESVAVDDRLSLTPGDVVRTGADSMATLRLEGARRLQLMGGTEIQIVNGSSFDSLQGSVLTEASAPTEVGIGDVSVSAAASKFRVDNMTASARTGVYEGQVAVDGPGSTELHVPALYQTSVTGGRVYERVPYALDESDPWDFQVLRSLVNIEDQLGAFKRGFATQLGGSRPDLAYFGSLTNKGVGFMKPYLAPKRLKDDGYTADLMVGFMVATHAASSPEKAFVRAYDLFFERDATWGIVAGIVMKSNDARLKRFVADLEDAFLGTGVLAESADGAPDFALPAGDGSSSSGGGSSDGSGSSGGSGDSSGGSGSGSFVPPDNEGGNDNIGGGGDDGGGGGDDGGNTGGNGGGDCLECTVEELLPEPPPPPNPPPSIGGDLGKLLD